MFLQTLSRRRHSRGVGLPRLVCGVEENAVDTGMLVQSGVNLWFVAEEFPVYFRNQPMLVDAMVAI